MKYRNDIDGLRALAVLPVIAFHLNSALLPGGFIGVDIFFVISGFLIGGIVQSDIAKDKFSIVEFYKRRIRRIFPALFAVLIFTSFIAWFTLFPTATKHYGQSLLATVFSVSNFFFYATTGYFDGPADREILLHTWSLSVEEQFYVVLPPLLILLRNARHTVRVATLSVIALVSFVLSAKGALDHETSAFYLLHSRAWELLVGVLLAQGIAPSTSSALIKNAASAVGLALIAATWFFLDEYKPFPGITALPGCLGAALIIWSGLNGSSFVNRLVGARPLVFVGLISYSLYLWHWPLIILAKHLQADPELTVRSQLAVVAATFVAAVASWWFIERPFRTVGRLPTVPIALGTGGALAAAGVIAVLLNGIPSRYESDVVEMTSYLDRTGVAPDPCFMEREAKLASFDKSRCLNHAPGDKSILLLGDSHAAHLTPGLSKSLLPRKLMTAYAPGCKPIIGKKQTFDGCNELMSFMFTEYLPANKPDLLILGARWRENDVAGVEKTLAWAEGQQIPVLLVGPIVEYRMLLPELLAMSSIRQDKALVDRERRPGTAKIDEALEAAAYRHGARFASTYRTLCPSEGKCVLTIAHNTPVQYDYGHLTDAGSRWVAQSMLPQIESSLTTASIAR